MARDLKELQKQYNTSATAIRMGRGPGGPGGGPRGRGGVRAGKSSLKHGSATIKRMLSYLSKYKFRIVIILLCMLVNTVASLCGGYL